MYEDKECILRVYDGYKVIQDDKTFKVNKRYIKARVDIGDDHITGTILQTDGELSPIGILDLVGVEWEECECTKMNM